MRDKRRLRAVAVVVVVLVTVAGNLAFNRHGLVSSEKRSPAAVAIRKVVDVASGKTVRCPDFDVTAPAGDADVPLTVTRLRARGVSCARAKSVMGGWLKVPLHESDRRVQGYRCSARPTNTEFNATCTRGSRKVTASYG